MWDHSLGIPCVYFLFHKINNQLRDDYFEIVENE